ncbi:MAG: PHP domain-containing protein [Clostridia bacterium]|nr:PHP domain-containing protein [Clostridia bacterium]
MRADLHVHSYFSDGLLSPEDIAKSAAANGVELIALTDHDNMLGCGETAKCCAARGIGFVEGIEISAYDGLTKIHTLGYGLDKNSNEYKAFSKELSDGSMQRAEDIISKLNKCGVRLSMEEVKKEQAVKNIPLHVMHIAYAASKKGYGSPFDFYNKYLNRGKPAFSNIARPTPERAVEVIKACGGFSSLAHPGRIDMPADELLKLIQRMKACGLDGIEAVYSAHTAIETAYYKETANALHLLVTGGSDTHYPSGNRKIGTPVFYAEGTLAEKLKI